VNPNDLASLNLGEDNFITLESRRGELSAIARPDPRIQEGVVMMSFAYREAAANLLTNEALDPFGKIPEFKYCAVKISATRV